MIRSYQGRLPQIPASCYVDLSAQLIGDVTLGERSSVWMNAVLRGDVHSIRVGANSNVQDCAVLHGQRSLYPVLVGDWVTIIAAGAVVPEHTVVPPKTLWAGVPAKLRRELGDSDRALILEYARNYLDYVEIYLKEPAG
jgi:carbonic anhydrase/acetyltransferase-like protein (isoleucine patch superfamily)